ncbi:MAG TPA: hypothetical protein VGT02_04100 [Methylomirabilota bacterium]|jgi:hypothetical protein|nr:hypothetical protein [Methylomirabilota bacterium]
MTPPRALERLYAVAPKDFTRARNALAAELRASDPEAARAIARLRRPSAALWAVNQLGRRAGPALERFLGAVDRLRRTQLSDPRGAMEAMRAERAQLETLVERAATALAEAGYPASAEARRRISDTLLGAAADRAHAQALQRGRLGEELQAPGFDALTGAGRLRVVQGGAPRRDAGERETRRREAAEARKHEREAKAREREREAETRRRQASERAAEVAALERDAAAARERLAEVERRLKDSRQAARRAGRRTPRRGR